MKGLSIALTNADLEELEINYMSMRMYVRTQIPATALGVGRI
jgi:hypothetical protein